MNARKVAYYVFFFVFFILQKEVRGNLEKILLYDREQKGCDSDEAYVGLYVDTIKVIKQKFKSV